MKTDTFWDWIEGLAGALDGDRQTSEQIVDQLELELRVLSKRRRDEVRRLMIHIVAGLSRLEVRMMEWDGPIKSAV
jgi:hypothetical protein